MSAPKSVRRTMTKRNSVIDLHEVGERAIVETRADGSNEP